jgi:hypothetical protein
MKVILQGYGDDREVDIASLGREVLEQVKGGTAIYMIADAGENGNLPVYRYVQTEPLPESVTE